MRIAMVGPFGLSPRMTMRARALQLARRLVQEGHAVRLVMPPWHTPEQGGRRWIEDDVEIAYVSLSPRIAGLSQAAATGRLLREVQAFAPDVVHVFKPIGHAGAAALFLRCTRAFTKCRPALIVDQDDWEGRGGWSDAGSYPRIARQLIGWQERWALRHADQVTVASRGLESLVWSLGVNRTRVFHLPNGPREWPAGSGAVVRSQLGIGSSPVVLLYTRFFEFDVARAAEAFRLIHVARPDCRLVVVGQGLVPQDEARFYEHLSRAGLEGAVIKAGWVAEADLPAYFDLASVALYPFDDTLINRTKCPVKLLDLLYARVPVVAEAIGEIREYVRHRENGLLVSDGTAAGLAEAAVALLDDPGYAATLADAAARDMRTRYAWRTRADDLLAIYSMGLERKDTNAACRANS